MNKTKPVSIIKLSGGYENLPEKSNILKDITIDFSEGTFTAIIGPNGSGKTTLLKYLINQLKAKKDCIFINSHDISEYVQKDLAKKISFVPQNSAQEYEFTVRELVSLGRYCHDDISCANTEIDFALNTVGIKNIEARPITKISGGELQLAMLARAICQQTDILILDEPTNNLDPKHQLKLLKLLSALQNSGKTIICVLHDLNAVMQYCNQVVIMKNGTVFAFGQTSEVLTEENIKEVYNVNARISPAVNGFPKAIFFSDNL